MKVIPDSQGWAKVTDTVNAITINNFAVIDKNNRGSLSQRKLYLFWKICLAQILVLFFLMGFISSFCVRDEK